MFVKTKIQIAYILLPYKHLLEMGGNKRTILTSSDAESVAWNNSKFSETLIPALRRGYDINTAFLAAVAEIKSKQVPQLDDDGDGIYSSRDGNHAAKQQFQLIKWETSLSKRTKPKWRTKLLNTPISNTNRLEKR
ncbi:hypothetical protein [Candidatus Marithrix sp. Canyon 246]|uniref:hypothetical protein n=1 Tax=Candidatus Marithrix sp. Canyon 246 TaxID=1827136 RepID=UPI00084A070B|nr:hypothetical protein [Candidatus Marithrix sp. Canyon 246]